MKNIKKNILFYLIFIIIGICLCLDIPYSIYAPGGLINVDSRLTGVNLTQNRGNINLTYVSVSKGKIVNTFFSLFVPGVDVIKNESITGNESMEELNKRDRISLYASISNATYLAYQKAGQPIAIKESKIYVTSILKEADTNLNIGDQLLSINNVDITSTNTLINTIQNMQNNTKINLKVLRDKKEIDCYAVLKMVDGEVKIGIGINSVNEYTKTPDINYQTRSSESGGSGGLMLSLAIYNALTNDDITKGKVISGTGTIDEEGHVGSIAGVKYKLAGAVKNKSEVFIVPEDNYEEAQKYQKKYNYKIKIIKAITFDQVIDELENLS